MQSIDGVKVEKVIKKVFKIFEKEKITANEGSAIAGMILNNSSLQTLMLYNKGR